MADILNRKILSFICDKAHVSEKTVLNAITKIKDELGYLNSNSAAQIYSAKKGFSVRKFLSDAEKSSLPTIKKAPVKEIVVKKPAKNKTKKPLMVVEFEQDVFLQKNVTELNLAYHSKCWTCVFILSRKIFECLIYMVLKKKFKKDKVLYWDSVRQRPLDFSELLGSLESHKSKFENENKQVIKRLYDNLYKFREDANGKTHFLFNIVESKKEIDDYNIQSQIDLISKIYSEK